MLQLHIIQLLLLLLLLTHEHRCRNSIFHDIT
jgi:hypothetical protein